MAAFTNKLELNRNIINFDSPKNRLCIFPYEWLPYSCRCILNCDSVVEKETCTTHSFHTFFLISPLFLCCVSGVSYIVSKESPCSPCHRCRTQTHIRVTCLHFSQSILHTHSHTPTHTHSHTPTQSSRQACCLICYFEPERQCDIKQLVYGERKKRGGKCEGEEEKK